MSRSPGSYSWLPGFLRKFLNLDDDMPNYGGGSYRAPDATPSRTTSYAPPARPAASYTPPSYTPSDPQRFAPTYTSAQPQAIPGGPPAPAPRVTPSYAQTGQTGQAVGAPAYTPAPGATVTPGGNIPMSPTEGYVQPVGYLLRSYARGALPPQGLEQFTRETRATFTDVWNLYSYWTRFQGAELGRLGRELLDVVADKPASAEGGMAAGGRESIRRIKVTTANGDEKRIDRVATATSIDPPPVPTPAAPPMPPPTTAVFSPTVTADDAVIPPAGSDRSVDFAARAAENAQQVQADVAADAAAAKAKLASTASDAASSAADTVNDAAKDATDAAKNLGDDLKGKA